MDWLKDIIQKKCRKRNYFERVWLRHKRRTPSLLNLVTLVSLDIRMKISQNRASPLKICQQIKQFVSANLSESNVEENRLLLLETVDIMATEEVKSRDFFRDVLTLLFSISKVVDREVYLFDCSKTDGALDMSDDCRKKMRYTLENIAGWKLMTSEPWSRPGAPPAEFYLDLPFRRINSPASTHMMAEALFRLQDPEIILDLLRHGASPSCIYLWPIIVMMDLKYIMRTSGEQSLIGPPKATEITESKEGRMVTYFCRARRTVHVNPIRASEIGNARMPVGVNYEDILLIPSQMTFLVPEELYKRPGRLQHLCRLLIRETLVESDCLPAGIYSLPIPAILQRYIDLLI